MYQSFVEISKSAILHNFLQYKKIIGKSVEIMPIVKSNAYGHGMVEVAKIIEPKIKWLGVASLGEALELRKNNIRKKIFVLSYTSDGFLKEGIRQNIDLPVYDLACAKLISNEARKQKNKQARVHIKIDTGTSRVGVLTKDALNFIKKVRRLPNLEIVGIYSHFAASEENQKYTKFQLDNFNHVLKQLKVEGINIPYQHFACSAAALVEPKAHFNLIRLGLGLYGLLPSEQAKKITLKKYPWLKLKPALTWKTKVIQVKDISAGTKVGYGCSYTAKRRMKIAVLASGYWEGYDRHLSNKGIVIIKNRKCPVIGRICMNLTMVDVNQVQGVKAGDEATLLGDQITAESLAEKIGTINYEVVTRINPVLERRYL
jgi:alanine racemase